MRNRPILFLCISGRRLAVLGVVFAACFILGLLMGGVAGFDAGAGRLLPTGAPSGTSRGAAPGSSSGSPPGLSLDSLPEPLSGLLSAKPLQGLLIALDPGHGGSDRGVCHFPDDLIEKEINLDMAARLKAVLEAGGARVLLTREEDVYLSLDERAETANAAGAHLFLSLHVNRIPGHPECYGAQTFYFPDSADGQRLAAVIQEELIKVDPENYRTPLAGSYRVLRLTTMPGALVEIGFMTNERDRELMATEEYRNRIAQAVALGVIRFVQERQLTAERGQSQS